LTAQQSNHGGSMQQCCGIDTRVQCISTEVLRWKAIQAVQTTMSCFQCCDTRACFISTSGSSRPPAAASFRSQGVYFSMSTDIFKA